MGVFATPVPVPCRVIYLKSRYLRICAAEPSALSSGTDTATAVLSVIASGGGLGGVFLCCACALLSRPPLRVSSSSGSRCSTGSALLSVILRHLRRIVLLLCRWDRQWRRIGRCSPLLCLRPPVPSLGWSLAIVGSELVCGVYTAFCGTPSSSTDTAAAVLP